MKDTISRLIAQAGSIVSSRSSALVPLHWKLLILGTVVVVLVMLHAPTWLLICFAALAVITALQSNYSYDYFMRAKPEELRSEKHAITKYAIDKGLYGDSDSGLRELPRIDPELINLPNSRRELLIADIDVAEESQ